ncbi:TonB-dependent receptor [Aliikangiella sp. G2MR2-5]|uniref:TonB-dependent receptor n=1 Tax=Aliikangiella sp. G2MR2-5 TaxID=2788943 RepID=UPI0018A95665|nr:TonB-dependent receptor [Aliikangiella sp. G2MR2-5]
MSSQKFKRRVLATSIAMVLSGSISVSLHAAEQESEKDKKEASEPAEQKMVIRGIRGSLKANINMKRFADTVSDAITAEDIGKFPDKNVSESLSRITGVGVSREFGEGEKITIRGSDPTQNRSLLNGQNVGTADWFILDQPSRGFNYTLLPSSLVKGLEVHKSPEANIDEGSIGGTVILRTRRPLELEANSVNVGIQGQYSDTSGDIDPQIDALYSWKNTEGNAGFLLSVTKQDRFVQREGLEVLGWTSKDLHPQGYRAPKDIGNPLFRQNRERQTIFASAQFVPTDSLDVTFNLLDSEMDANNSNQNLLIRPQNDLADLTNTSMEGINIFAATVAADGSYEWDFINRESRTETSSYDLDINYDGDGSRLHIQIGTTEAEGGTYNETSWSFIPNVDPSESGYSFDLSGTPTINIGVDPTNGALWGQNWTWGGNKPTTDEETYAQLDYVFDVEWNNFTSIETGIKLRDHDRTQGRQAYSWHGPGTSADPDSAYMWDIFAQCPTLDLCGQSVGTASIAGNVVAGNVVNQLLGDRDAFMRLGFAGDADFAISDILAENWAINETITAAYVKGNFEGDNIRGNVGLRWVKTEQSASSNEFSGDSWGFHTVDRDWLTPSYLAWVTEERSYSEILPSFNLAYNLDDDRIIRFAAARVMARPNFSDLAPSVALGNLNGAEPTAVAGNPGLKPTIADQFDISYEWYFDDASIFSATFFYKDIESYRDTTSYVEAFYNETISDYVDVEVFVPSNGVGGTTKGIELGFQQQWEAFGLAANYTYTDAEHDAGLSVAGASEHMFNTTFFYETDDFGARLMYNYRSEWFNGPHWTGAELWTESFGQIDFSSSYNLTENVDLVFEAVNLNDEEVVRYDGDPARLMSIYQNGRRFVLGVNLSF